MLRTALLRVSEAKRRLGWLAWGFAPPAVILGLVIGVSAATANAQERNVWQIGKHDNGSLEFNQAWNFSTGHDPLFIVGQSDPQKDWSHFQPGSGNSEYGERAHPFTIEFDISGAPRGTYYLVVDLFFKEPLIPILAIDINGKKGRYWLHPTVSYDLGDPEMFDDIIPATEHLRIPLAASFFHQGKNTLVLTSVGESGSTIHPAESKTGSPSGAYYDDLQLSNDPSVRFDEKSLRAEAHPSIFYRQGENKGLNEVVLVDAETGGRFESGTAALAMGGAKYSCDLPGGYDFGESECAVEVPEFKGTSPGKLMVHMDQASGSFEISLTPQKKWNLYEVPQNHIDAGYTDYRAKSYEVHNRNLDRAVQVIESHPWYKFNLDGSFDLEQYWLHRDQVSQDKVAQALKNDRIGLPALNFTLDTGTASQEELNRLGYFSQNLGRRYGIPVEYANQTDLPAHSWALPSFLSAQGVKYLNIASDPYRGPILYYGRLNEKSPFWWEGPDGGKVLTWYSWDYIQMGFLFGIFRPVLQAGVTSLPIFLQPYSSSSYAGDAVMIFGNVSDNRPFNPYDVEFSQQWNSEFAYPKITVATVPDFFHYMERNFGTSFATLRGDGGATWEEMIAADAQHGAIVRHTVERAVAAEYLASLGVIANQGFKFPMEEDYDLWHNLLLYNEHSWGGIGRTWRHADQDLVSNLFRAKQSFSTQAEIEADVLLRRGLDQLTSQVTAKGDMLLVFNALSWERAGTVQVDLPRGSGLIDLQTQQPVATELVRRGPDEDVDRLRFWADGVPAIGYRSYAISKPSSASAAPPSELAVSNVMENKFYKITVDPSRGGIASIYDKELGQELVDQKSSYALDEYVYAGYGHEGVSNFRQRTEFNSTVLQYGSALPAQQLQVSTGGGGKIVGIQKTTWGTQLTLESSAAHTPKIETEIVLFDQVKRIELVNRVHKEVVKAPEAVYVAFPFLGQNPTVRYEIQNGWVDPSRDELPGANTEWFSAQHWVAVSDATHTVGLALNEAPLLTIGDIVRGHWPKTLEHKDGTIFSYIMNNYDGDDDLPWQGGDFTFHYALTSAKEFNSAALTRFGLEADNPLERNYVRMGFDRHEPSTEALQAESNSFMAISGEQLVLSTWKAAEDGKGYVLRFYNTTDQPAEAQVGFPHLVFDRVERCNGAEVDQAEVPTQQGQLKISLGPHEIGTYRVTGFGLRP